MTGRGRRPRRWHVVLVGTGALGLLLTACGGGSGAKSGTTVTYVGVAGGDISLGVTQSPTGCNPNTPEGDTPGTQTVLGAVLPSPFIVNQAGVSTANSNLIESSELVNTKPETIVYTLNPKAVWSDGVPITATDFAYAWSQQRGDPSIPSTDVASIAGYRDISSVTGSNGGHTVTVTFKTTFADWQSLFANLMPAHVLERTGWNPDCATVDPNIDLSGGPFKIGSVTPQRITLVQNPKWWGTPANARSITVDIASSTEQLTQWISSGFVQVAEPSTVTQQFLTTVTGLPGVQSEVDTSDELLQLDMASALGSDLSPDLRVAIALSINRQNLVNQSNWAVSGLAVANSHVAIQGQQSYKSGSGGTTTTTIAPATSSTSTTVIGAGGSVNFPVTPVPSQVNTLMQATGLVRSAGFPYYHSAFGATFQLHIAYDASDPWAVQAAPLIENDLKTAGLDATIYPVDGAAKTGQTLADGFVDMALLPVTFTPYMSQTLAWYTNSLGPPGKFGSQNWTGFSDSQFTHLLELASQQLNPNTAATYYSQADTRLWDNMVSLPLYAEPTAIAWSRRIGGMTPTPRSNSLLWYAQLWALRQPESTKDTTPSLPGQ